MAPTRRGPRPAIAVIVTIEAGDWPPKAKLAALARRTIGAAVDRAKPKLAAASEVSLTFTDDRHIRVLNRTYRGKDKATNVLSFPASTAVSGRLGPLLGDIALASGVVSSEAAEMGESVNDHLNHLIVHGFLHLLGYDHAHESDAAVMEGLEVAILGALGIANPYLRAP